MKPFLKWAGGKQKVLSSLVELLPSNVRDCRYVEPFVGGGAMFFRLEPETAVLGDVNERLVCCYRQVRDNVEGVLELLEPMAAENSAERYAMRRNWFNASTPGYSASAALFIYLNKTCFNGLYRENKNGKFNVPYGKYEKPLICDADHLRKASSLLKRAELLHGGFTQTAWVKGDFVYLDPPYDPVFEESHFTSYHQTGFGKLEQSMLAEEYMAAHFRGAKLMLSNADTEYVRELYKDFNIRTITAPRSISRNGKQRQRVGELVITNY
jgi:DNA adenine methylase